MYIVNKLIRIQLLLLLLILATIPAFSQQIDFSHAKVYFPNSDSALLKRSPEILQSEIEKRTDLKLEFLYKKPSDLTNLLIAGLEKDIVPIVSSTLKTKLANLPKIQSEGFKILVDQTSKTIIIAASGARGILYGIGYFLRKAELSTGEILVNTNLMISSSPKYPVRGHQLGYRPKTNAYDAFSVAMFDQYIRELALFGANTIEILPPRTDDDATSIHMKLPASQMIVEQSRICKEYGLDVSIWYPNMGKDYQNADSIAKELKEREIVFSSLPKLNAVFVPAGDPGDLEPDVLFNWLKKEADLLQKYHPKARIWVSPQVFRPNKKWYESFFAHVNKQYPWFGGVVFGPWVKIPVDEIRKLVKPGIPIRNYPDITHNYSSQYPVPHWDLAWAMTLGRESINPRPHDEKSIHNALDQYMIGSVSYSEGTNDDVNKFVWSDQDWNPETPVIETLRDYARLFIGKEYAATISAGLVSLENNWKGEVLTNDGIDRTFLQWKEMEKKAAKKVLQNPRFQMGLIRAYFDFYTRQRLIHETEIEREAREVLSNAKSMGAISAMDNARQILEKAWKQPVLSDIQSKCNDLADSLFKSIGAQLTMKKHGAMSGRGNFMDLIHMPLNDAPWLLDQMEKIRTISGEADRLAAIHQVLHRTDAGPGGFYDHFGDPESWDRVVQGKPWEKDPGSLASPRVSFGVGLVGEEWVDEIKATGFKGQVTPRVWMKQVKTLYDQPLKIHYDELDPTANYLVRISYTGRFRSMMKMTTDDGQTIHDYIQTGEQPIYEFKIPHQVTADGKVTFIWNCAEGERGSQVTEIWLIRQ